MTVQTEPIEAAARAARMKHRECAQAFQELIDMAGRETTDIARSLASKNGPGLEGPEELQTDTWMQVLKKLGDWEPARGSFLGYWRGVARNLQRNQAKKRANRLSRSLDTGGEKGGRLPEPVSREPSPRNKALGESSHSPRKVARATQAISQWSVRTKEVIERSRVGESDAKIAKAMGIDRATVHRKRTKAKDSAVAAMKTPRPDSRPKSPPARTPRRASSGSKRS